MSTKSQAIIGTATAAVGACACAYAAYQFQHSFLKKKNNLPSQQEGHENLQEEEQEQDHEKKQGYGFAGMLRYIWEGDHLPPHIREAMDALEDIEVKQKKFRKKLNKIDVTIEVAKLNSVDDDDDDVDDENNNDHQIDDQKDVSSPQVVDKRHYILAQIPSLAKDLGTLSYNLDAVAAEVDAVQSSGDVNVKRRKKQLSSKLVAMMDKVDAFMKECGVESN